MKLQIGIDGQTYEVDVDVLEDPPGTAPRGYIPPYLPVPRASAPVVPPAASATAPTPGPAADGDVSEAKVCRSPIAGVLIKVNVQVGQTIQINDLLMVLEAMKMETNVTAPVAGKIKSIRVEQGGPVQVGQILVEFE